MRVLGPFSRRPTPALARSAGIQEADTWAAFPRPPSTWPELSSVSGKPGGRKEPGSVLPVPEGGGPQRCVFYHRSPPRAAFSLGTLAPHSRNAASVCAGPHWGVLPAPIAGPPRHTRFRLAALLLPPRSGSCSDGSFVFLSESRLRYIIFSRGLQTPLVNTVGPVRAPQSPLLTRGAEG